MRIDYVSSLDFGRAQLTDTNRIFGVQKISSTDQTYYAAPDEMTDGSKKPTYVQVTDRRGTLEGWTLSLTQSEQFKTADGEELAGAALKFTNADAVSTIEDTIYAPKAVEEFELTPGEKASAITATQGTGVGTWVYRFGKDIEANENAVQLFVPGRTVKLAKEYKTTLIWALENTPGNE